MIKKVTTLIAACAVPGLITAAQDPVIQKIVVKGNENVNESAIRAVMRNMEGQPYVEAALRDDEKAIRDMGFFKDVKVLARSIGDNEYEIVVELQENPLVNNFEVIGNTIVSTDAILDVVKKYQEAGQVYNLKNANPISSTISNLYQEKGYFAQIDLVPKPGTPNTLEVKVIERVVNDVKLNGLVRTKDWVIRRIITTKPGEPFNAYTWDEDRRKLETTNWFESVSTQGKETGEMGKLDLILDFKETHTGTLKFGAAMSELGGLAASFGYSDSNFLGRGQTVAATLQYSLKGGGLSGSVDYVNPFFDKRDTIFSASAYSRVNNFFTTGPFGLGSAGPTPNANTEYNERRTGGAVNVRRPLNKSKTLYGALGVRYEDVDGIRPDDISSANCMFIEQDGGLFTAQIQGEYDGRDVPTEPTRGQYARVLVEPAFGNLRKIGGFPFLRRIMPLGNYSFLRTTAEYKYFLPIVFRKNQPYDSPKPVLAFRARYGIISGDVPFYEQFFIGGSDSLRGFPEQRFWGKQSFLSTLEFRYPLQRNFSVFVFGDLGGAWDGYPTIGEFCQTRDAVLHPSYGAGVLFRSPLGPIQLSVGWGDRSGKTKFNLTVGYTF